jgi:deazaflavin-dependent oxidoreductase (nitroreductase family)
MQANRRPVSSGGEPLPGASPLKRRLSRFTTNRLVNPLVRRLLEAGLFPSTHALLETTGRKSGVPRRVPIGNGLRGDAFWIVTEHGNSADYVKNIRQDPNVRVKVGRRWLKERHRFSPGKTPASACESSIGRLTTPSSRRSRPRCWSFASTWRECKARGGRLMAASTCDPRVTGPRSNLRASKARNAQGGAGSRR